MTSAPPPVGPAHPSTLVALASLRPLPEPAAVPLPLGPGVSSDETFARLLHQAADAARALTGGAGFGADRVSVDPEIAEILVRSVARCLFNPESPLTVAEGPYSVRPGCFSAWSDADLAALRARSAAGGP